MHRFQGRAGQLELAARLERDAAAILGKGDRLAVLLDRLPAEAGHALQKGADTARTVIGKPPQIGQREGEFLVLGADTPFAARLGAIGNVVDELALARDGLARRFRWRRHVTSAFTKIIMNSVRRPCGSYQGAVSRSAGRWFLSPNIACQQAMAASAAVSARRMRGPNPTGVKVGFLPMASSSADDQPPSGPMTMAHGDGAVSAP